MLAGTKLVLSKYNLHNENHYDHVEALVCGDVEDDGLQFELRERKAFSRKRFGRPPISVLL